MMCPNCNATDHEEGARFCHVCGTELFKCGIERPTEVGKDPFADINEIENINQPSPSNKGSFLDKISSFIIKSPLIIQDGVVCGIKKKSPTPIFQHGELSGWKEDKLPTKIVIPQYYKGEKVSRIESSAFLGEDSITEIIIPNTVESIGVLAFQGCRSLIKVVLSESLTEIEDHTFTGCISLEEITIPKSVVYIGEAVFLGCDKLKKIVLKNRHVIIDDDKFFPDYLKVYE